MKGRLRGTGLQTTAATGGTLPAAAPATASDPRMRHLRPTERLRGRVRTATAGRCSRLLRFAAGA